MRAKKAFPIALLLALVLALTACGGDGGGNAARATSAGAVPFDRAFIDAMVPHHRDAIEMANAAKTRGLSKAELQKSADDIVDSQRREIDQMLAWREEWFGSRDLGPVLPEVLGVAESELGMKHGTADEIAGAVDVDAKFAELMIPHHRGAIAMAKVANERGQHEQIKSLADAIIEAQEREIATLEKHAGEVHHG